LVVQVPPFGRHIGVLVDIEVVLVGVVVDGRPQPAVLSGKVKWSG
jgi:hypothetical protein